MNASIRHQPLEGSRPNLPRRDLREIISRNERLLDVLMVEKITAIVQRRGR